MSVVRRSRHRSRIDVGIRGRLALGVAAGALVAALLSACEEKQPGRALAPGLGRDVVAAPDGRAVAFFLDAAHPDDRSVPEDLFAGDLWLADLRGTESAHKIGAGVPTTPSATVFRDDGAALAFLASFRFRSGEGELTVAGLAGAPRKLASAATSFAWAPHGNALAWIEQSHLFVAADPLTSAAMPFAPLELAQSFSWSPDGKSLVLRARGRGRVLLLDAQSGAARELASDSSDFKYSPDGAIGLLGAPGPKGGDRALSILEPGAKELHEIGMATSFGFSPDGKDVLMIATDASRGASFGDFSRVARAGGTAQPLGEKVNEFRFTSNGDLLFLANYDTRARAGSLMVALKSGSPVREIAPRVQTFQISPSGDRVLYLTPVATRTDFKIELWTAELAEQGGFARAPRKIDDGVYGYELSRDGTTLFWKASCIGSRSCNLYRAPVAVAAEPVKLATLVAGFDLAPQTGRLLVSHPHQSAARAVDLTMQDGFGPPPEHAPQPFVTEVDPSSRFLDDGGHRVIAPRLTGHSASVRLIDLP